MRFWYIGPVKQKKKKKKKKKRLAQKCDYFLTHQFKHVFWVLKGTVSSRRLF